MPHEWEERDDEVAAGAICLMPHCGALAVAYGQRTAWDVTTPLPWEFTCPRCRIDFAILKDELIFPSVPKNGYGDVQAA
jgi:hypothetical protein